MSDQPRADADHAPVASEVRAALEPAFARLDPTLHVELLGTVVVDDRTLVVLVRDTSTGAVHRTRHDVEDIRVQGGASSLSRIVDEVLHGSVNYQDLSLRGKDPWGVHEWS